ncbi:MAG TPA: dockerin type I domain-containing protein, partial [Lacipirellulaceae bacterium]|nr:dockerin type I domain-containing protein [Lacipirellulaceae bacterium]
VWHENISATAISMSLDYADYNHNGVVDASDYVVWRKMLNTSVTNHTGADGDGDGHITMADFTYWKSHLGDTSGGSPGAGAGSLASFNVPEPASGWMAILTGCLLIDLPRRWKAKRRVVS